MMEGPWDKICVFCMGPRCQGQRNQDQPAFCEQGDEFKCKPCSLDGHTRQPVWSCETHEEYTICGPKNEGGPLHGTMIDSLEELSRIGKRANQMLNPLLKKKKKNERRSEEIQRRQDRRNKAPGLGGTKKSRKGKETSPLWEVTIGRIRNTRNKGKWKRIYQAKQRRLQISEGEYRLAEFREAMNNHAEDSHTSPPSMESNGEDRPVPKTGSSYVCQFADTPVMEQEVTPSLLQEEPEQETSLTPVANLVRQFQGLTSQDLFEDSVGFFEEEGVFLNPAFDTTLRQGEASNFRDWELLLDTGDLGSTGTPDSGVLDSEPE